MEVKRGLRNNILLPTKIYKYIDQSEEFVKKVYVNEIEGFGGNQVQV